MKLLMQGAPEFWALLWDFFESRYEGRLHSDYTVTSLIDSPRVFFLTQRHNNELKVPLSKVIPMLLGNCVHYAAEQVCGENETVEKRLYIKFGELVVSCKPDRWLIHDRQEGAFVHEQDIKVCKAWAVMLKQKHDWIKQVNINAYISRINGIPVKRGTIEALIKDWTLSELMKKPDYPRKSVLTIPVKLWSDEACHAYLWERVQLFESAKDLPDNELPLCTEGERWARGACWKVKKTETGRTIPGGGNLPSKRAAEALIDTKDYPCTAEFYSGEAIRCTNHCWVSRFCSQFKEGEEHARQQASKGNRVQGNHASVAGTQSEDEPMGT